MRIDLTNEEIKLIVQEIASSLAEGVACNYHEQGKSDLLLAKAISWVNILNNYFNPEDLEGAK